MATRTIASPGVQITEQDLSIITRPIGATDILITGFAPQGPTEDLVNITDLSEFEQIYGAPTNSAERYLYHSAKQILNTSPGNLLVSRLPYGSNLGEGYVNSFSALIYPITGFKDDVVESSTYELTGTAVVAGVNESALLNALESLGGTYSIYNTTTAEQDLDFYKSDIPTVSTFNIIYPTLSTVNVKSSNLELTSLYQNTSNLLSLPPFSTYSNQTQLQNLFSTYSAVSTSILENEWVASLPSTDINSLGNQLTGIGLGYKNDNVDINDSGTVIVIGENVADTLSGINSGRVRVFELINQNWVQKGSTLEGDSGFDEFGHSVAINGLGTRIAVGIPNDSASGLPGSGTVKVYDFINNNWQLISTGLTGSDNGDLFGSSVALNQSGDILVVGNPNKDLILGPSYPNAGTVKCYQYSGSGTVWNNYGSEILPISTIINGYFGSSVDINSSGTRIVVGSPGDDNTGSSFAVFDYNGAVWNGTTVKTISSLGKRLGISVSINSLGDIIAASTGTDLGEIYVYKRVGSSWSSYGQDIIISLLQSSGDLPNNGNSVSLNRTGDYIVIGLPVSDISGLNAGEIRVYKYTGSAQPWTLVDSINGEEGDRNGTAVSFNNSSDSNIIISASYNSIIESQGKVNVYEIILSREITVKPETQQVTSWSMSVSTYEETTIDLVTTTPVTTLSAANRYEILPPVSILLTDENYNRLISNDITWKNETASTLSDISDFSDIGKSGIIIINNSKTSINNLFEGYYVGITDNANINPATNFDSITGISTTTSVSSISNNYKIQKFLTIPSERLNFKLTEEYTGFDGNSLSESLESYPTGYDFGTSAFDDSLIIGLFKIKTSIFNQDTITLDYRLIEGHSGSLYSRRTQNNPTFGSPSTFYIESVVDKSSNNLKVMVNPFISKLGDWTTDDGKPAKKVTISNGLKNLYPSGVYSSENDTKSKDLGNIPLKLQRILNQIQNDDTINLDVVAEAGLGTVWVGAKDSFAKGLTTEYVFDENEPVDISDLKDTSGGIVSANVLADYQSVASKFLQFVTDRKDHVFIADPLRYIYVNGKNFKSTMKKGTTNQTNYVFSNDIYWPLKNQFSAIQSSYVCTYGNWLRANDDISDQFVWLPPSGFAAAIFASTSQIAFPWAAPAGLNRGTLTGVFDLGIVTNQKQSDLLYKINVNPISFFGTDGFAIFGQKTLYRKPSAFDRINVRRLFLTLEKEAKQLLKYFVFEPNTFTTRQRLIGALEPSFEKAKLNDGLYEYEIVCDERNNTPDVIDNNELKIAIYIKPVRTAEFILAEFIGTRTGVSFSELIQ